MLPAPPTATTATTTTTTAAAAAAAAAAPAKAKGNGKRKVDGMLTASQMLPAAEAVAPTAVGGAPAASAHCAVGGTSAAPEAKKAKPWCNWPTSAERAADKAAAPHRAGEAGAPP
eukprot:6496214-Prymnesium_polylepis.1